MMANVGVPGRTRWTVFDAQAEVFYANIADPAQIVVLPSDAPDRVARTSRFPLLDHMGLILTLSTAACSVPVTPSSW